jgi:hypothetical protein
VTKLAAMSRLKTSYKQNCLQLLVDFVCRLLESEAPAKLKDVLIIDNWPLIPLIISSIVAYLLFGPAADQLKSYLDSFMISESKSRELTHSQKVEDGHKIIGYL